MFVYLFPFCRGGRSLSVALLHVGLQGSNLLVDIRNVLLDDEGEFLEPRNLVWMQNQLLRTHTNLDRTVIKQSLPFCNCEGIKLSFNCKTMWITYAERVYWASRWCCWCPCQWTKPSAKIRIWCVILHWGRVVLRLDAVVVLQTCCEWSLHKTWIHEYDLELTL